MSEKKTNNTRILVVGSPMTGKSRFLNQEIEKYDKSIIFQSKKSSWEHLFEVPISKIRACMASTHPLLEKPIFCQVSRYNLDKGKQVRYIYETLQNDKYCNRKHNKTMFVVFDDYTSFLQNNAQTNQGFISILYQLRHVNVDLCLTYQSFSVITQDVRPIFSHLVMFPVGDSDKAILNFFGDKNDAKSKQILKQAQIFRQEVKYNTTCKLESEKIRYKPFIIPLQD